jgi:NAD(P)-dependent dehydrogenase (short-subunit alcohol dehydrogenase family)
MGSIAFDFTDQVVVVTGASSGIGRAIALGFAESGATVINADVRSDPRGSHNVVPTHELGVEGRGTVRYVETDVSDPDQVRSVVDAADDLGGIDVMVNNAGVLVGNSIIDVTPAEFDRTMAINVGGTLVGTQAAALSMRERDVAGAIVNLASINSTVALPDHVAYDTSKGGVRMLTQAAALDLADTGIRVNAVAPGVTATEVSGRSVEAVREGAATGAFEKAVPVSRAGRPAEIADAVQFLASDATAYVTGELLHVDGGWHAF